MRLRSRKSLLAAVTAAAMLVLVGCGGDDKGSGKSEPKKDVGSGPVTVAAFQQCIAKTGNNARPVPKEDESDSMEATRKAGVPLQQVTVETKDFAHTAFVAVFKTEADAEKAEPAAKAYDEKTIARHGNAIVHYYGDDDTKAALEPILVRCTP